jgi:hypothetical protein
MSARSAHSHPTTDERWGVVPVVFPAWALKRAVEADSGHRCIDVLRIGSGESRLTAYIF